MATFGTLLRRTNVRYCRPRPAPQASALLESADFVYLGAFRLPASDGTNYFGFASGRIAYDHNDGKLYACSRAGGGGGHRVCKVTIPALVGGSTVASLNRASIDINGAAVLGPVLTSPYDTLGGMAVLGDRLYLQPDIYYDASGEAEDNICWCPRDLSGVNGPYRIGSFYPRIGSNGLCEIPADYQGSFGGTALACCAARSIVSNSSDGPACAAFDPDDVGGTDAPATQHLYYSIGELDSEASPGPGESAGPNSLWASANTFGHGLAGAFFHSAGGKRGVGFLVFRVAGQHWYGYGNYLDWRTDGASPFPAADDIPALKEGESHYASFGNATGWPSTDTEERYESDLLSGAKGTHGTEMSTWLYMYDPDDLLAAAELNDPVPYELVNLVHPFAQTAEPNGGTFDAVNRRLFVSLSADAHGLDSVNLIGVWGVAQAA